MTITEVRDQDNEGDGRFIISPGSFFDLLSEALSILGHRGEIPGFNL